MAEFDAGKQYYISKLSSWDSGGGIQLDIIELKDGRILAVSEEAVVLYGSMEEFLQGEGKEKEVIYL